VKPSHTIRPVFDDPNLVSAAGLVPVLWLAESAGMYDLLEGLTVPSPNASAKTASVVGGMLAGADSIDDLDLLRHGGMGRLFAGVRALSTLGTFLRTFTHGDVQQLDKISAGMLAGLARQVPELLAGEYRAARLVGRRHQHSSGPDRGRFARDPRALRPHAGCRRVGAGLQRGCPDLPQQSPRESSPAGWPVSSG
jgi:hypothetical protein